MASRARLRARSPSPYAFLSWNLFQVSLPHNASNTCMRMFDFSDLAFFPPRQPGRLQIDGEAAHVKCMHPSCRHYVPMASLSIIAGRGGWRFDKYCQCKGIRFFFSFATPARHAKMGCVYFMKRKTGQRIIGHHVSILQPAPWKFFINFLETFFVDPHMIDRPAKFHDAQNLFRGWIFENKLEESWK